MAASPADLLFRYTDASFARPLPRELREARVAVAAAVDALLTIPDAALARPWSWKGGSEEELRYGFYRILETFERAEILALAASAECDLRERAGDLIAPATAARWDLQGLLAGLPDTVWDAQPGDGEWTIRRTLGHVIGTQFRYGVATAWWQGRAYHPDDEDLPEQVPDDLVAQMPDEESEAQGAPASLRARLDEVLDRSTERLAGLPDDRLPRGGRWSGFAVDIAFRLGRWSSHIREHTVQVEKTLAMLDYRPTEVGRLVRLVLAAWGRAESTVYGSSGACEGIRELGLAAAEARSTAEEVARLARS